MSEEKQGQELKPQNQQFIEIDAPERLQVRQNLYDQEPFSSLVKNICESTGKTPDVVRTAISLFAENHFDHTKVNPKYQAVELLKEMGYHWSSAGSNRIPFDDKLKMLETLQTYPFWSEYIVSWKQNRRYGRNGNFIPQTNKEYNKLPPSYANWVTEKLQREKRLWLVGIEEIFPSDTSYPVISQPNITGIKPGNRRYKILKAAEIIK